MKQQFTKAFKQGFFAGALMALTVYIFARILFYEFTFTAWEEVSNFFLIIVAGGLMVSATVMVFLLLEKGLQYLSTIRISLSSISLRRMADVTGGPIDDLQTAA